MVFILAAITFCFYLVFAREDTHQRLNTFFIRGLRSSTVTMLCAMAGNGVQD